MVAVLVAQLLEAMVALVVVVAMAVLVVLDHLGFKFCFNIWWRISHSLTKYGRLLICERPLVNRRHELGHLFIGQ